MKTPEEYLELSDHFGRLADVTPDAQSRNWLQALADSYRTLAKSAQVLNRSGKALEALERTKK